MFQVLDSDGLVVDTWLGGGADLTPYVLYESDVSAFHSQLRSLCAEWDMDYDGMKKNCDEYFYIPCRKEHRGVGGIFFDDIPADGRGMGFVDGLVKSWMDVWLDHIVEERQRVEWTEVRTKRRVTTQVQHRTTSNCPTSLVAERKRLATDTEGQVFGVQSALR